MLVLLRTCFSEAILSTEQVYKLFSELSRQADALGDEVSANRLVLTMAPGSEATFASMSSGAYSYHLRALDGVLTLTNVSAGGKILLCEAELPESAREFQNSQDARFRIFVDLGNSGGSASIVPGWESESMFAGERLEGVRFTADC